MNPASSKKYLCCFLAFLILLSGCSLKKSSPTGGDDSITAPYQPFRVIQICLDTPPVYSESFFRAAAHTIADRIDSSVTVNFGGMEVYVALITHNSYPENVLQFSIPAFPADPAKPQLIEDPNVYGKAEAKIKYEKDLADWQRKLTNQHLQLARLRNQVKQHYTDKLRSLPDPYDDKGADQFGCLQNAAQHFQRAGDKYLLIASALLNNTNLQKSVHINLAGAVVRVIWRPCQVADICQTNDEHWKQVYLNDGAKTVSFYDPATSDIEKPSF